jgi:hypothetical protein
MMMMTYILIVHLIVRFNCTLYIHFNLHFTYILIVHFTYILIVHFTYILIIDFWYLFFVHIHILVSRSDDDPSSGPKLVAT